jgi:hypothetical protein
VLPENAHDSTSSTNDLDHDALEDSSTVPSEAPGAPSEEADQCEEGQGSEQTTAVEENCREEQEVEDLAVAADQLTLTGQEDAVREESLDQSPAGMIWFFSSFFFLEVYCS